MAVYPVHAGDFVSPTLSLQDVCDAVLVRIIRMRYYSADAIRSQPELVLQGANSVLPCDFQVTPPGGSCELSGPV